MKHFAIAGIPVIKNILLDLELETSVFGNIHNFCSIDSSDKLNYDTVEVVDLNSEILENDPRCKISVATGEGVIELYPYIFQLNLAEIIPGVNVFTRTSDKCLYTFKYWTLNTGIGIFKNSETLQNHECLITEFEDLIFNPDEHAVSFEISYETKPFYWFTKQLPPQLRVPLAIKKPTNYYR